MPAHVEDRGVRRWKAKLLSAGGFPANAPLHRYAARLGGYGHLLAAIGVAYRHGARCLWVWVDGKSRGRGLIARHEAVAVLKRLHQRQTDIRHLQFEVLFQQRLLQKLARISTGYQPVSLNGTFRRLPRDAGLLLNQQGYTRTHCSL